MYTIERVALVMSFRQPYGYAGLRMKPVQDKVNDPLKIEIVFMAQRPPDIKLVKE